MQTMTGIKHKTASLQVNNTGKTRMWANAQLMVALPNICGALGSMPQSLADAHY